jgi:hypothetical protein
MNLLSCLGACGLDAACPSSCTSQYPDAVAIYDETEACVMDKCAVCSESGVGDPCSPGYPPCQSSLTCNGSFCSEPCATSSTCAGLGPAGGNTAGMPNVCAFVPAAGDVCVPTCTTDGDCASLVGLYCKATTDVIGSSVQICAPLPDGG